MLVSSPASDTYGFLFFRSLKALPWLFSRMMARRDECAHACLAPGFGGKAFPFPKSGFPSYATLLWTLVILWHVHAQSLSLVWLVTTPWTVAHQALLSMGFSRQEQWSGLPFPTPGDLPDPGIEPASPALAGRFFTTSATWEALRSTIGTFLAVELLGWWEHAFLLKLSKLPSSEVTLGPPRVSL